MDRSRVGRSKVAVSRLGFGGAPLGNLFARVEDSDAIAAVRAAYDAGMRFFDTAPLYGMGLSERRMGYVLQAYPRDSYALSTKVGRLLRPLRGRQGKFVGFVDTPPFEVQFDYSRDGALRSVEDSMQRIGTDYFDIVFIHDVDVHTHGPEAQKQRFAEAMDGAYPALDQLRRDGVVGAVGLGVNEWQSCAASLRHGDFDCFLLAGRYSLLDQSALDVLLPECERRHVSIVIGGPYNSGILATGPVAGATYDYAPARPEILERTRRIEAICRRHGVPLPAAALQFPYAHPAIAAVIPGGRTAAEVASNVALFRHPIPPALWRDLKAEKLLRADAPVPA